MVSPDNDRVTIHFGDDGVAQVRLNRPDKMNALDPAMFAGIIEAWDRLSKMKGLRAVVLAGEGRSFCAGHDVASFARTPSPDEPENAESHLDLQHGGSGKREPTP